MDTGAPPEDCASVCEYTFYQAKSLEMTIINHTPSLKEHTTIKSILSFHKIAK